MITDESNVKHKIKKSSIEIFREVFKEGHGQDEVLANTFHEKYSMEEEYRTLSDRSLQLGG